MKRSLIGTIGLVLLVAGIAVLAVGAYQYYEATQSLGGGIAKVFKKLTKEQTKDIYLMVGGGAAAVVGFLLSRRR
jgi:hypothetical protein